MGVGVGREVSAAGAKGAFSSSLPRPKPCTGGMGVTRYEAEVEGLGVYTTRHNTTTPRTAAPSLAPTSSTAMPRITGVLQVVLCSMHARSPAPPRRPAWPR